MSVAVALALLAAPVTAAEPPLDLMFGYFRMAAFHDRARDLRCRAADLDAELERIRKRLATRYGEKAFTPPKHPPSGPGDCDVVMSVYRVNLRDFRQQAEAALAIPASSTPTQGK